MLDLRRLEALQAVSSYGSVSNAADMLALTTSAVSQQINKLEREIGQPLLVRHGRGVKLTDAALLLVRRSEEILSLVAQTEAELDNHRGIVTGSIAIAAFSTALRGLMPHAVQRLSSRHPDLSVVTQELEPDDALPQVVRGDVDIAIVDSWLNAPLVLEDNLNRSKLLVDPVEIALPAAHPMADEAAIDLRSLSDENWVSWPKGTICHDWLLYTMRTLGCEPRISHTAMEHPTQLALVAACLGVAILPRLGRGEIPSGVVIVPPDLPLAREVNAVWRQDTEDRPALRAALSLIQDAASLAHRSVGNGDTLGG